MQVAVASFCRKKSDQYRALRVLAKLGQLPARLDQAHQLGPLPRRRHLVQECQALGAQHTSQCAFEAALWRKLTMHPAINTNKIADAV